jgi:hypothetical protein
MTGPGGARNSEPGAATSIRRMFSALADAVEDRPRDAATIERLGALLADATQFVERPSSGDSPPAGPTATAGPDDGPAGSDVLSSRST